MDLQQTRKVGLDKFYTKTNIAKECIDILIQQCQINKKKDFIIEPSAGDGSFLNQLGDFQNKIGIDIQPENEKIVQQDFFDFVYPTKKRNQKIITLGNPPFGKNCSLAIKFFNKASLYSDIIAFIIPKTFKKNSIINKLDQNFHLQYEKDLPLKPCCFEPVMNVKTCFQIWIKKDINREIIQQERIHKDWEFLAYGEKDENNQPTPPMDKNPDIALLAYGGQCGRIIKDQEELQKLRPKSWHWIKSNIDLQELIKNFQKLDFSQSQNTSRQNSIGRAELVALYKNTINID